ncbi:Dehydrogenase, multihelical [Moorella glycerini]|uniref:Polyol:NADP oxidoreductase n=1 Tax=Neomoorella stamsii TaxID=1266720 RepID=A0A9X7P6Y1_9FIRM|nr:MULTISPECIES: mannitol dehydrogenase family protein [Moorella]PRR74831.1 Polyol:NADP oxidoreductase [Moorella stamsii]CEP67983.1 Dehydrogenase, multihelical [Moorella glycerini]
MPNLSREGIKNKKAWQDAGIELPEFDYDKVAAHTRENPVWLHFGAGNIFRGFIAMLQQRLLNMGKAQTGIVAVEAFDFEIIDKIYIPYDNLSLFVIMYPDGTLDKKVVGSISEGMVGDVSRERDWERLKEFFTKPSLQMVSFTITEKGYSLKNISGEYYKNVLEDMQNGPGKPGHIISKVASLAYTRYKSGELPIAFVSMDNYAHNGEKLHESIETIAKKWVENGLVDSGFLAYINDESKVSFPWTMIDKIVPRPSEAVKASLLSTGFEGMEIICTKKNTYIAPFVNAEGPQYLVIEDNFPNGRLPLELAGVLFTDRQTVDRAEKMKVCTCLNPLHTALAVFGCLLGYNLIADEMKDSQLKKLVEKIGYEEGLPVVINPGILSPEAFIREVIEQRLPNPFIPDTPQRIVTDTSQKIGIRFGETIKAYRDREDLDPTSLTYIPLTIAGWCRYLLGLDDKGQVMPLSPDPMLNVLKSHLSGVKLGDTGTVGDSLKPILANENIFGLNLYDVGLGEKIEGYFKEMVSGPNAVRNILQKYLG